MSIIELQRRIAEVGRLRIGEQVATSNGKTRPAKLETWRITSSDRQRVNHIAELYGGEVREWQAPAGLQWEVVTESDSLPVIVPPSQMAFSQHMELWSASGCLRRCDGAVESISDHPCLCDPDNRECSIHTRLSVLLRDVPGLGVYRLDTSGFYAAVELQGAVEIIHAAAGRGAMLPARLRLEQRTVKRTVEGETKTRRFVVPVLDIEVTPAQLMGRPDGLVQLGNAGPQASPGFTPVPALPEGPGQSIAEQSAPLPPRPKRSNAAPEIPRSGRQRNTQQPEPEIVDSIRSRILDTHEVTALKALWDAAKEQNVTDAETTDGGDEPTTLKQLITDRLNNIRDRTAKAEA